MICIQNTSEYFYVRRAGRMLDCTQLASVATSYEGEVPHRNLVTTGIGIVEIILINRYDWSILARLHLSHLFKRDKGCIVHHKTASQSLYLVVLTHVRPWEPRTHLGRTMEIREYLRLQPTGGRTITSPAGISTTIVNVMILTLS